MSTVTCDFAASEAAAGDAQWRDLPMGVQIKMRPLTGLVSASIQARLSQEIYAFHQGEDVISRYGFASDDAGLLADEHIRSGFAMILLNIIRAQALIIEWNLVDADGDPIEISPVHLRDFFQFGPQPGSGALLMSAFQQICDAPAVALAMEKKGFASSLNGATAAGANTAKPAGTQATPAPSAARSKAAANGSVAPKTTTARKQPPGSPR